MTKKRLAYAMIATVAVMVAVGIVTNRSNSTSETTVSALAETTHFHGIAVDPNDPSRLYLATHHGFFVVAPDGTAVRVSETRDDFMGFSPHPADPTVLYASGHPATGGNLGFIISTDGGKSWSKRADGVGGPVDFHQMDVSKADPNTIYGVYGGLQVSRDGGHTWEPVGPAPDGLIDLAASARDVNTLFAATKSGLYVSKDGGQSWQVAYLYKRPATMVQTAADGAVYAFVFGTGLLRTTKPSLNWSLINNGFGEGYILHLAVDPTDKNNLYAVADTGSILASKNGGQIWTVLGER